MTAQLVVPDIRTTNLSVGWAENHVVPAVIEAAWDDLDEYEASLRAMASYIDSLQAGDAVELEKALRIVEARRGELLGFEATPGRPTKSSMRGGLLEVSDATAARYRKIARHWQTVWPRVARATERREVTQAAILRLIEEIEAKVKETQKPTSAPKPATPPAPEPDGGEEWGEVDLLAEFEQAVERLAKAEETIEHLSKPDAGREILALHSRIAGLEARIGQLTTTAREAQKQAEAQAKVLRQIRKALNVERNSEIMPRLQDIMG